MLKTVGLPAALLDRMQARELPTGWSDELPSWAPDQKGIATRKASAEVLASLADVLPELWGGSADLAESNNTTMKGADSFGPEAISTGTWNARPYGRTLHFGIREHAMGAILNGIALHGGTRPYGGTFMVFSDYMRPAVRLAALMHQPVIYVWTHDSIGLGEDGPTHQPVEHAASLRLIPNMDVWRPCDTVESAVAWTCALERRDGPSALLFSRQNVAFALRAEEALDQVRRGGYVLSDAPWAKAVLIATGSEVPLALEAQKRLAEADIPVRVVSMPSTTVFDRQEVEYRAGVLPPGVRRVAVATYYGNELNDAIVSYFSRFGIQSEVMDGLAHGSGSSDLYTTSLRALDEVSYMDVYRHCKKGLVKLPPVDAVYINGGGWDAAPAIALARKSDSSDETTLMPAELSLLLAVQLITVPRMPVTIATGMSRPVRTGPCSMCNSRYAAAFLSSLPLSFTCSKSMPTSFSASGDGLSVPASMRWTSVVTALQ